MASAPTILPWRGREIPHAVLDLGRGCDLSCAACYNRHPAGWRSVAELTADLDHLRRARRLHTVTLAGGEPTLHAQLPEIIALVRSRGLVPTLLTNGRRLDAELARRLAAAGLAAALVHLDAGQRRDDLAQPGEAARAARRAELAAILAQAGIAPGFQITAYRSRLAEVVTVIRQLLASPHAHHLLVTGCTDLAAFHDVRGSLAGGLHASAWKPTPLAAETVSMGELAACFRAVGLPPFAALPASAGRSLRWLGAAVIQVRSAGGVLPPVHLGRTLLAPFLPRLARLISGRYPFHLAPSPWRSRFLALAASRPFAHGLAGACASFGSGRTIEHKVIVMQQGPRRAADGQITCCRDCPDATWRGGRLLPVCLADACNEALPRGARGNADRLGDAP